MIQKGNGGRHDKNTRGVIVYTFSYYFCLANGFNLTGAIMTQNQFWKYALLERDSLVRYAQSQGIAEAEDLVQSIFTTIAGSKSYLKSGKLKNYKAWFQAALNLTLMDRQRTIQKHRAKVVQLNPGMRYDPYPELDDRIDRERLLSRLMSSLTVNEQFLVHWHYIAGYTLQEIAENYEVREEVIKTRLARIRKLLSTSAKCNQTKLP